MAIRCRCGHIIEPGDEAIGKCKVCQDIDNANRQNQQYSQDFDKSVMDILTDAYKRSSKGEGPNGHLEVELDL